MFTNKKKKRIKKKHGFMAGATLKISNR